MTTPDLLVTAIAMHQAGLAVVPVARDGSKRPAVAWKNYQAERPTSVDLQRWFAPPPESGGFEGLGVLTGPVSGELELLEVEGRAVDLVPQLAQLLNDSGLHDLWQKICGGWMEKSPSGGIHWLYRVDGPTRPNTKLARRPGDQPHVIDVLIETRGTGGFVVTAPSNGRSHPTGQAWTILAGGPTTIPTLTVDERDALYLACSTFDQMPIPDPVPAEHTTTSARAAEAGARPGDDYNDRTSWDDILIPHGWTKGRNVGPNTAWTRPGKNPRDGISATTSDTGLYVFTTSTEFEAERPYSKFGAYAHLEHAGDHAAAASALRRAGYGAPIEERRLTIVPDPVDVHELVGDQAQVVHPINGATALAPLPLPSATLAHTDDANALLLVDRYGDQIRYCVDRGRWFAWNGALWESCHRNAGPARELAKQAARDLPENDKKDVDFKKKSLSALGISNTLAQAASIPAVTVSYSELDARPWELNTPGGIVDLRTGAISPADPSKLHTRSTRCTPDWNADRSAWLDFLDVTFNGDQELIGYMQRLVGYSAVGVVGAHVLPYCYGSGGNGKGVFLETSTKVLGDYATTAPAGFLMAKAFQGHETEIARLAGARMVLCSEVNEEDRFDEARVKLLTGGDSLTARFMQQDHFTFTPSHQLWVMGNYQPHVRAGGPSFWRRLRLIPFVHSVPEKDVIDDLQDILATEHGPAILSWIIDGAVAYGRQGLQDPKVVLAATDAYQRDQDTVSRFLEEACRVGGAPHVQTKVAIIRSAYESWCHEAGDAPVTAKAFGTALQRRGIESTRTASARFYSGLALIGDENEGEAQR